MNPWLSTCALVLFIASHVWAHAHWQQVGRQTLLAEQAATSDQNQQDADTAVTVVEAKKNDNEHRNRERREQVTDYAQTDSGRAECFDDAGLRAFNAVADASLPAR